MVRRRYYNMIPVQNEPKPRQNPDLIILRLQSKATPESVRKIQEVAMSLGILKGVPVALEIPRRTLLKVRLMELLQRLTAL